MAYIETETNIYPWSERDIRTKYPDTSFPKPFRKAGYEYVFATPKPQCGVLERVVEGTPVFTNENVWEQTWLIVDMFSDIPDGETKEEQEAAYLQSKAETSVANLFTSLKTDFITYIMERYDLGTQGTIQMAYTNEDSSVELKAKAKEVGDWILTVQAYYKAKKLEIFGGAINTPWDFSIFDTTKPSWDFDDFV